ncbi:MAG: hypothetical protein U9R19_17060 [Bacteroidota bacterium]|nr:hypothetical protein [Bacteroidota bacterium]
MKTLKTLVLIVIAGSLLVLSSCNKDDDNDPKTYLKYDNEELSLKSGYLENYGQDSTWSGFNVDLTLYSTGVTIHEIAGELDSISGFGMLVYFEIYTSNGVGLDSRDFVYDVNETGAIGTFDLGVIANDIEDLTGFLIEDGVVNVKKDGNNYEITINCTDENGKEISGYYKGELKYYDYSGTKSLKLIKE